MLHLAPDQPGGLPTNVAGRSTRIDEFDVGRGVSILFVIYLHSYFTPWPGTPKWEIFALGLTHLAAHSAVPVFLFMSGFLAARDRSANFDDFGKRRVQRLILPMAFWMTAALGWEAWRRGGMTVDLLRAYGLFDIEGQFYYLLVLFVLTFAAYPLRRWSDRRLGYLVIGAFVLNLATVWWYSTQDISGLFATVAYRNPLMWIFAFTFGLWLGRTRGNVQFGPRITVGAIAGMVIAAGIYVAQGLRGYYPDSYFGVTVFLVAAFGFVVYPAMIHAITRIPGGDAALQPFRALAPYAFAIYLVHKPYFIGYLSDLLLTRGPLAHHYLALVAANAVVGGGLTILAVVAADRVAPRLSTLFLGVEHPRRLARIEAPPAA